MRLGLSISIDSPSRRRSSFSPASVAGILAWFDASQGITLNGSTVAAWADQSGTGDANKNMTQGVAGAQPTYVASTASLGGKPSLLFDGSNDALVSGTWTSAASQPLTIYSVLLLTDATSARIAYDGIGATNRAYIQTVATSGNLAIGSVSLLASTTSVTNIPVVACGVYNSTSSALYINAITTAAASGTVGVQTLTGIKVGLSAGGSAPWKGNTAELIIRSGVDSSTVRSQHMTYLGAKYGVTVAA